MQINSLGTKSDALIVEGPKWATANSLGTKWLFCLFLFSTWMLSQLPCKPNTSSLCLNLQPNTNLLCFHYVRKYKLRVLFEGFNLKGNDGIFVKVDSGAFDFNLGRDIDVTTVTWGMFMMNWRKMLVLLVTWILKSWCLCVKIWSKIQDVKI